MRAPWLDGVAAGALLALSMTFGAVPAAAQQPATVEGVPVPEPANVPPPGLADVQARPAAPAAEVTASVPTRPVMDEAAVIRAVPLPESANVPPPTAQDVGTPPPAPADVAIADKLRELVTANVGRFIEGKKEAAAVAEFYKARKYAPVFAENGAPTARMTAAIARLKQADADGLEAADFATPDVKTLADPAALAQAELTLTNALLAYARQAQVGRVTVSRISPNIDFNPTPPDPAAVLATLAEAKDVAAALDAYNPPHQGFHALRAKLAELRGTPDDTIVQVPAGPTLKPGKKDKRVPLLRQRLQVEGDPADHTYDKALVEAVKAFQKQKGQKATGTVTNALVELLNGRSRSRDVATILSNMERWRWLPRDLGPNYVMVNIPDFTLKAVRNGQVAFHTRIVVGKPNTPSPSFSAAIENVLVNPSWHVPQSIIYGEYLPALERDPEALARMGLQVTHNRDGSIAIKQPPGERNALGRIKFNFPNKYQVYLHDTPTKHLFAHDRRAYSHGCMRVQNPAQFAEVLLSIALPEQHYSAERVTKMYGSGEQWLRFKKNIPVHLVYLNAYVDDAGKLVIRDDVYGWDKRVQSALNGHYVSAMERSQKVVPGAAQRTYKPPRQVVEEQPRPGFFLFPFLR
ncbi:MAG: L,D-transpeptidase family protein [Variibacter sp.]|nr:L,D-transpeptidase family protein [Variibacter sp.]